MSFEEIRQSFKNGEYKTLVELAELSYDAVSITNENGQIVFTNQMFEQITGYKSDEVIGLNFSILQGELTEKEVTDYLNQCLKNKVRFEGKTINYDKNKKPFMMTWRVMPVIKNEKNQNLYLSVQKRSEIN